MPETVVRKDIGVTEMGIHYTPSVRRSVVLELPKVEVGETRIRLAMHTDNLGIMVRYVSSLPESERRQLSIEGRMFPDTESQLRLMHDPVYRFYLQGRHDRADGDMSWILPRDLAFDPKEVNKLVTASFSPRTLMAKAGYGVVYYNSGDLVNEWKENFRPINQYLPLFGGSNELRLGSDTLSRRRLRKIANGVKSRIAEDNGSKPAVTRAINVLTSSILYPITPRGRGRRRGRRW